MKILLLSVALLLGVQTPNPIYEPVAVAFRDGDAQRLSRYFGDLIDLKIDHPKTNFSRTHAKFILRRFFEEYPPKSFTYRYQDTKSSHSQSAIGDYVSRNGKKFRIYYLATLRYDEYLVRSLSISKI